MRDKQTSVIRTRLSVKAAISMLAGGTLYVSAGMGALAQGPDNVIYLVPFSHLDLFWGGTREECLARGNQIIAKAIQLAERSPQFRFLLEDNVFVANYMDSRAGSPEVAKLKSLVKAGRIEIAPKWAAIFQGLPDGEVHARNLAIGKWYARHVFGVEPQVAHLGDLPGYTLQFPQILRLSGVPFAVMTRMGPMDKSLFNWVSPDGSKVLIWNALKGYGWGTFLTSKTLTSAQKADRLQRDLADLRKHYVGPVFMNWGSDLFTPADDLVGCVEEVNNAGLFRVTLATPTEFFNAAKLASNVPEAIGEIPESWPNVVSSLAHMWPLAVPATATLLAAERFATINYALGYAQYPQAELDLLWKKLVESMDHNHNGQGGALGDSRKIEYSQLAMMHGGEILREMLRNIAERAQIPFTNALAIVVFNPLGWLRDDIVCTHVTLYGEPSPGNLGLFRSGMRLLDASGAPVPFHVTEYSENISRALQVVFCARDVPPLGYKTYYLVPAEKDGQAGVAVSARLDQENDRREPRRPLGSDTIENRFYQLNVDRATGRFTLFDKELGSDVCRDMEIVATEERGGNYIGIEPPTSRVVPALVEDVVVEETNAVRGVIRIASRIGDIPITQRLTLYSELKRLDIENVVQWKSPRFLRIEQLFPVCCTNSAITYGIAFGANSATNLLPGTGPRAGDEIKPESWRNSRLVQHWIHAGNDKFGLTIATDHQQVRLGQDVIRAQMLRGTRFTSVKVVRANEITSLHYPPPGLYTFRYSLSSGPGNWKATKAYRNGFNFNNPLLAVSVVDNVSAKSLPPEQSFCTLDADNLVLSALKKADRTGAIVVRVYEVEGMSAETTVRFLGQIRTCGELNLLEEELAVPATSTVRFNPYQIKTFQLNATRRDVN